MSSTGVVWIQTPVDDIYACGTEGLDYGSESLLHPFRLIINGGCCGPSGAGSSANTGETTAATKKVARIAPSKGHSRVSDGYAGTIIFLWSTRGVVTRLPLEVCLCRSAKVEGKVDQRALRLIVPRGSGRVMPM